MKKTIILLAFVFAVSGAFAQKGKVTSAQNLKDTGKLDKAFEAIGLAVDPANEIQESRENNNSVKKTYPSPGQLKKVPYKTRKLKQ